MSNEEAKRRWIDSDKTRLLDREMCPVGMVLFVKTPPWREEPRQYGMIAVPEGSSYDVSIAGENGIVIKSYADIDSLLEEWVVD